MSLAAVSGLALVDPDGVAPLSEGEAREVTEAIRQSSGRLWAQIEWAYCGRAWSALGYADWDAYVTAEFAGVRLQLPREDRDVAVRSLREHGMSVRAISAATGVPRSTVADVVSGVRIRTPEPDGDDGQLATVVGLDGKRYPTTESSTPAPQDPTVAAAQRRREKVIKSAQSIRRLLADEAFPVLARQLDADAIDDLERLSSELASWAAAARTYREESA